jgi:hypothetical protein
MAQLSAAAWYLTMVLLQTGGIVFIGAAAAVLIHRDDHRLNWVLALPALWISPLLVTAATVKDDATNTADWVASLGMAGILATLAASLFFLVRLNGVRLFVALYVAANLPFAGLAYLVVLMASSGTWL